MLILMFVPRIQHVCSLLISKKNLIDIPGIEGSEMLYTPGLSLFDYLVLQANLLMIIKAALYVCSSIHR